MHLLAQSVFKNYGLPQKSILQIDTNLMINILKNFFVIDADGVGSKFCACEDSLTAMACAKMYDLFCTINKRITGIFQRHWIGLWFYMCWYE